MAAIDDLGVAGDNAHAGRPGGLGHRGHDAAERFHRQTFFEDEARTEVRRLGPGHGQVVDGSIDGQFADVAAGEEEWMDDERVGGEGQPRAGGAKYGGVVRRRGGIAFQAHGLQPVGLRRSKGRQKKPLNQLAHQPSSAAVRELHGGVVAQGDGTAQVEIIAHTCFLRTISAQTSRTSCQSCGETSWGCPKAIWRSRSSGLPP